MPDQVSDEDLVREICRGADPEGKRRLTGELFERYYARVGLWCLRFTGRREQARDLAQEIFLKVQQNLQGFEGNAKFSTWLYVVTRNHCINVFRRKAEAERQSVEAADLETVADDEQPIDERLIEASSRELMFRLMQEALSEAERRVVKLHYVDEMPLAAITRLLGLENDSGAKAYIVSGRRKLDRAMARIRASEERRMAELRQEGRA